MKLILAITIFFSLSSFAVESNTTYVAKNFDLEQDNKRFSFMGYQAMMPDDFGTLYGLEFQMAFKMTEYWIEAFITQGAGNFESIFSDNSSKTAAADSEGNFIRADDQTEKFMQVGLGLGLMTEHFNGLFNTVNFYERVSSYLTYTMLKEELRTEDYYGLGIRADYSINYRFTKALHFGVYGSYRFSPLKRTEKYENEDSNERTLMLSMMTLGADLSVFY